MIRRLLAWLLRPVARAADRWMPLDPVDRWYEDDPNSVDGVR